MAMQVMLTMIRRTGRCPLPMHDSFLVAEPDVETLAAVMMAVGHENNLRLALKSSTGHQWAARPPTRQGQPRPRTQSLFHMGVKNFHLPKSHQILRRGICRKRDHWRVASVNTGPWVGSRGPPLRPPLTNSTKMEVQTHTALRPLELRDRIFILARAGQL